MRAIGMLVPREVEELSGAQKRLIEKAIEEHVLPVYRPGTRVVIRRVRRMSVEAARKHRAARDRRPPRRLGRGRRMLPTAAVPYAALISKLTHLKLELSRTNKKALFHKLASLNPGDISKARLEVVPAVEVDVGRLVGDVMDRTERYLRSWNEWITTDEAILGGALRSFEELG
ncbi:hypothetical protein [Verrucomicrobium sp. 3C]|uniref:hypothetical protein n=1 Tax=Verrucomicrobium sp. 3C TaxID=1134055 RepID=UPI00035EDA01|nr:hypothetical protein [Verrucomicrobium sp. 3C]